MNLEMILLMDLNLVGRMGQFCRVTGSAYKDKCIRVAATNISFDL